MLHQAFVRIPDPSGVPGAGYMIMLPRFGTGRNYAHDIADDGTVVGYSAVPKKGSGYSFTALRWRLRIPGTRPVSSNDYLVEALGPGAAYSINARGDIAGSSQDGSAVWWPGGGGIVQLARCCEATAINDDRDIVGRGAGTGAYGRAMLWRP